MENVKHNIVKKLFIPALVIGASMLTACGGGGGDDNTKAGTDPGPVLDMGIPKSITGGENTQPVANNLQGVAAAVQSGTGEPCSFIGDEDNDPFRNGYKMTKFTVSIMATWTCVADTLIGVSGWVPHDGQIHEADNDLNAANYDPKDPTHYSVTDESQTQVTVRLYYGYDRATPPQPGTAPQFYISWNRTGQDDIEGRLIIDALQIDPQNRDPEDPASFRMDFDYTATQKQADMFLRYDNGNPWANGFRIQLSKDLAANPLGKVFLARGLVTTKAQFFPVPGITELPEVHMYTVSDSFGNGAAIARFDNLALPLLLNTDTNNHLGNYLFNKDDVYYFKDDQSWDWVNKTITSAQYRGARTTPASGGTWAPFDPSLDMIISGLALDTNYFSGTLCANTGDDCTDLLNAVFADGFAGQEPNQGSDPMDWRSAELASPVYLDSVYPNGVNWDAAFDHTFTPTR